MERKWVIAISFLSTLFVGSLAQAQAVIGDVVFLDFDSKTFSGNFCQPYFGNQSADFQHRIDGTVNVSGGLRYVSCPVIRDNTSNTTGTGFSLTVSVNNIAGQTLRCYLRSNDMFGNFIQQDTDSTNLGGNQKLIMQVSQGAAGGNYSVYCYLPNLARIGGYQLFEFKPTDSFN